MRESDLWSLPACARIARWDVEFMEKRRASPACTESNFWGALSLSFLWAFGGHLTGGQNDRLMSLRSPMPRGSRKCETPTQ